MIIVIVITIMKAKKSNPEIKIKRKKYLHTLVVKIRMLVIIKMEFWEKNKGNIVLMKYQKITKEKKKIKIAKQICIIY